MSDSNLDLLIRNLDSKVTNDLKKIYLGKISILDYKMEIFKVF